MSSYGGERRSQLRTGESWAKALRALRCESISSRTPWALLRRPWLQRSPLLSPEARGPPVPKRLPLPPGSRASLPRPRFPACLLLPPSSMCCQLRELLLAPPARWQPPCSTRWEGRAPRVAPPRGAGWPQRGATSSVLTAGSPSGRQRTGPCFWGAEGAPLESSNLWEPTWPCPRA